MAGGAADLAYCSTGRCMSRRIWSATLTFIAAILAANVQVAHAESETFGCRTFPCPETTATSGAIQVSAQAISDINSNGLRIASNSVSTGPALFAWSLRDPCTAEDAAAGVSCDSRTRACPQVEGRVIQFLIVQRQRLAQADGSAIEDVAPPRGTAPGSVYGPVIVDGGSCVDITALNPPPSPGEVYRYFQTLPLPDLPTQQQPPGNALAGLPVVFYTDGPTTQTFTVDIRGFTVDIVATASGFTWDTGDGTVLQTTDPGAPYPHHTISHDYRSGTYTASLTTTWSGTFSLDGGATADVPGTTTTDGPPATFTVLQASPVLTNPFD